MSEKQQENPEPRTIPSGVKTRRARTGRKRTVFGKPARPAWPVRGLWESAPQEEKERAHRSCMTILEYWLGKKSKTQVAEELSVTPLRVWQLSQAALSGMMAGLLAQPRKRVPKDVFDAKTGQSTQELSRRIAQLEKELSRTEDLVRVLRAAPWVSPSSESASKGGTSRGKKTKRGRSRDASPTRGSTTRRRLHTLDRALGRCARHG